MKLDREFYTRNDVVEVARDLLGKFLITNIDGILSGGMITETEAYAGVIDKASHAYGGRRTNRTEILYSEGGVSYVYLCYGIHHLFNVVTDIVDIPNAVLIRGLEPTDGLSYILERSNKQNIKAIADGPGKLTKVLAINMSLNKINLCSDKIWIEDRGRLVSDAEIKVSPRIGIDYAEEDASLPYRFNLMT